MRESSPKADRSSEVWGRAAAWMGLAGLGFSGLLLVLRALSVFSFAEPLQLTAGGTEEEAMFALWKFHHGLPIYADPHKIPFAASYYNWGFFTVFGVLTSAIMNVAGLADPWIPTVAHLISLVFCLVGILVLYALLRLAVPVASRTMKVIMFTFAANFFIGPLMGFWSFAIHPELIACTLMLLSFYVFCRWYETRPFLAVLLFCVAAYAAWAMKQYFVFSVGGVGLILLFRRDWRMLGMLVVALPAAWALTPYLGGEDYTKLVFFTDTDKTISADRLVRNLVNMIVKSAPLMFGAVALIWVALRTRDARSAILGHRWFGLFACSLCIALVILVPLSGFVGASENYYFAPVAILTVLLIIGMVSMQRRGLPIAWRPVFAMVAIGWAVHIAAISAVLLGYAGVIDKREQHRRYVAVKQCLDLLAAPVFVPNDYNMLPWMHPPGPHFVLNYNYERDRKVGRPFERGGIGGLIGEGYFGGMLLFSNDGAYDGTLLRPLYVPNGTCAGHEVWVRRDRILPDR